MNMSAAEQNPQNSAPAGCIAAAYESQMRGSILGRRSPTGVTRPQFVVATGNSFEALDSEFPHIKLKDYLFIDEFKAARSPESIIIVPTYTAGEIAARYCATSNIPLYSGLASTRIISGVAASAAGRGPGVYSPSSMMSKGVNNDGHTPIPIKPVSLPGSGSGSGSGSGLQSHAWLKLDMNVYAVADQPRASLIMDLGIKSGSLYCNDHFNASLSLKYKKRFGLATALEAETPSLIEKTGEGFAAGVILGSAYYYAKGFLKPGSVQEKFVNARKAVGSNFLRAGFAGAAAMAAFSVLQSSLGS